MKWPDRDELYELALIIMHAVNAFMVMLIAAAFLLLALQPPS